MGNTKLARVRNERVYLTEDQKDYIKKMAGKKYISEMARKLKVPSYRIHKFLIASNISFKRVDGKRRSDMYFPEGCFNPHERENWLL